MLDLCPRCYSVGMQDEGDPDVETYRCLHCSHRVYGDPVNHYSDRHTPRNDAVLSLWERRRLKAEQARKLWQEGKDRHQIADRLGVSHRSTYRYV